MTMNAAKEESHSGGKEKVIHINWHVCLFLVKNTWQTCGTLNWLGISSPLCSIKETGVLFTNLPIEKWKFY